MISDQTQLLIQIKRLFYANCWTMTKTPSCSFHMVYYTKHTYVDYTDVDYTDVYYTDVDYTDVDYTDVDDTDVDYTDVDYIMNSVYCI